MLQEEDDDDEAPPPVADWVVSGSSLLLFGVLEKKVPNRDFGPPDPDEDEDVAAGLTPLPDKLATARFASKSAGANSTAF